MRKEGGNKKKVEKRIIKEEREEIHQEGEGRGGRYKIEKSNVTW
jgi:hypothetical protein